MSMGLTALALRCLLAYGWLLVLLRLDGKRGIGQAGAFNFVLALILGDLVDNMVWGDVPPAAFLVATAALLLSHLMVSTAAYVNDRVHRLLNGHPCLVVSSGSLVVAGLRRERLRRAEVLSSLRSRGVHNPQQVRRAAIEETGQMSVMLEDWAKPVQRQNRATLASPRSTESR